MFRAQRPTPVLVCKCGYSQEAEASIVIPEEIDSLSDKLPKVVGDREEKIKTMPTTNAECPKCGHNIAFWWMTQVPIVTFYRCESENCGFTWRDSGGR